MYKLFKIKRNNNQKIYKVYSVRCQEIDGETYFLIYDIDLKGWYWLMACDCEPAT